ncbi:triple functional domain protein-like [Pteropus vampyrus]|uniref:Triple functional domain protein-like n=1 Tax=Pteropus vampyrus TaxID=132908 RepID=A0A6P6C5J0_PTEVA|nr:triple functional domain protein-like [Pteropus vampyrus]
MRKRRLDQCQQYVVFERSAKQALEWIHDNGEFYLSTHTSTGSSIQHTQELLKEHEEFQITAKVRSGRPHTPAQWLRVGFKPRTGRFGQIRPFSKVSL